MSNIHKKILIIAEAGVNHNGDIDIAKELIVQSAKCGADYIKFQSFTADEIVTKNSKMAKYQKKNTKYKSQYEMLKKLEFKNEWYFDLIQKCKDNNIKFLSSAFDISSIKKVSKYNHDFLKIPSGEITNFVYLKEISKQKKNILLSTGMSSYGEIEDAISILTSYKKNKKKIILLHCTSEYPTPFQEVNLRVLSTLKNTFNLEVGFSDHSKGINIPIASAAFGIKVLEKHFTLNTSMDGPDHSSSLDPIDFKRMVKGIREVEKSLGSSRKSPTPSELKNKLIVRKSIVAKTKIKKGDKFSFQNLDYKRPGDGLSPMRVQDILGREASKDFEIDEKIII